jgi:hypothetical protein
MMSEIQESVIFYKRKRELTRYLDLLMKLNYSGIRCEKEINQALKELNSLMFDDAETFDEMAKRKDEAITRLEQRCVELYERLKKYEDVSDLD